MAVPNFTQVFNAELINRLPIGIIRLDDAGRVYFISDKAFELLNKPVKTSTGISIQSLLPAMVFEKYISPAIGSPEKASADKFSIHINKSATEASLIEFSLFINMDTDGNFSGIDIILNEMWNGTEEENIIKTLCIVYGSTLFGVDIYKAEDLNDDASLRLIYSNPISKNPIKMGLRKKNGLKIDEVFPNLRKANIPAEFLKVITTGIPFRVEEYLYQEDSATDTYYSFQAVPVPFNHVAVYFNEITEKKKADTALKEKQRQLTTLISNLPGMVYRCKNDEFWTALFISEGCLELTGFSPEEFYLDKTIDFLEITHPDDRKSLKDSIEAALQNRSKYHMSWRLITKDQKMKWVWEQGQGIYKDDGTLEYLEGIIIDISDKMHAFYELEKSERKFRSLIDNMFDGLVVRDENGRMTYANKKTLSIFGIDENEINLENKYHLINGQSAEQIRNEAQKLISGEKEVGELVIPAKRKDGSDIWLEIKMVPIFDEFGKYSGNQNIIRDITEQKRGEEKIRSSENRFRSIFEEAGIGMTINDKQGKSIMSNQAFRDMTGYSISDLECTTFVDYTHPDDFQKDYSQFCEMMRGERERYIIEKRFFTKDRQIIWGRVTCTLVRNEKGNPEYTIRMIEDVTERVKHEKALHESEEMYRKLVAAVPDLILRTDLDGNILFTNEVAFAFEERLLGKNILSFVAPEDKDRALKDFELMLTVPLGVKEFKLFYNNSKVNAEINSQLICDENNKPYERVFVIRNVTERKKSENAIKMSSENFKRIFELSPYAMTITSMTEQNLFIHINMAYTKLFGLKPEDILGKPSSILVDPEDARKLQTEFGLKGEINKYELKSTTKSGKDKTILLSCRIIEYDKQPCILSVFFDITKQKKAELELDNYRKHLEDLIKERTVELNKVNKLLQQEIIKQKKAEEKVKSALEKEKELSQMKSRFISIASHEFRTPLTTIYSSTQLLEKYGRKWSDEMYYSQFARIKEYVHYLTEIMDDMLTISRTESGKIKYEPKQIDLKSFFDNIVSDISALITPSHEFIHKISLKNELYFLDEKLLKYILLNLLSNAIKYSPKGGKIQFIASEENNKLSIKVSDEGIGISEKDRELLFEPFHRGDNVGEIQGTGLGMSIVKKSIDMHRGTIDFKSDENKGTQFIITIPLKTNEKKDISNRRRKGNS